MNVCHPVFPSPLGKQRMNGCRKSGLFLLTVRSYQGEIDEENLASPYSDNQTTCSFMWFAEWEQVIYMLKNSSQTPKSDPQCSVSVGCWGKRIAVDANKATRVRQEWNKTQCPLQDSSFRSLQAFLWEAESSQPLCIQDIQHYSFQ